MNKRQKKKNEKKYLPIIADEGNLLTMTDEELTAADKDYLEYSERYAFRKKYKDLKNGKPLSYYFPLGQKFSESMKELSNVARRNRKPNTGTIVSQSINDFQKH
jgi:hypothetical protein